MRLMLWYLGALGSYCLGYGAYAGAVKLGLPGTLARILGVLVGLAPLGIWLWRRVQRERAEAAATPEPPREIVAVEAFEWRPWQPEPGPEEMHAEVQQRVVPCRRCGAAMAPVGATGELERMQCRYCQLLDDVPRDAASRDLFLRGRAAELRGVQQGLTDSDRKVAEVLEDGRWIRGTLLAALGPTALILLLVVLPGVAVGGATGALVGVGLLSQLGGIVLGMWLAYRGLARRYLKLIRPRILARPPERPGAPARCRVCGGPIHDHGSIFTDCRFCGSANLISRELMSEAHRFLEAEVAEYRRRAARAEREIASHHQLMRRGVVAGNVLGSMLGSAAAAAVVAAIWHFAR